MIKINIKYIIQNRDYETNKIKENVYRWIASKLPKRFVYFVAIELWAKATSGKYGHVDSTTLTVNEALNIYTDIYEIQ